MPLPLEPISQKMLSKEYPGAGLPGFSWYNIPNNYKIYQIATKYTKLPQNIPNCNKIYQIAIKWTKWTYNMATSLIARPSKIFPNRDFWFENMISGNPGQFFKKSFQKNTREPVLQAILPAL
jgi:hypothetical protein